MRIYEAFGVAVLALLPLAQLRGQGGALAPPKLAPASLGTCHELQPRVACEDCCLQGHQDELRECKSSCTYCVTFLGFIHIGCRVDERCFRGCVDRVSLVSAECHDSCEPEEEEEDEIPSP